MSRLQSNRGSSIFSLKKSGKKIILLLILSFLISSPALAINLDNWQEVFSGYGYTKIDKRGITLEPMTSTDPDETHAALVTGPEKQTPINYRIRIKTKKQLRQNSEPNPWEVGWVVWNYTDNDHFYYFIPKPNGWELGKRDPDYEGGQRFLATGSDILFPIHKKYVFRIKQTRNNTIKIYHKRKLLVKFKDTETPYTSGKVGVYSEDAKVRFSKIKLKK